MLTHLRRAAPAASAPLDDELITSAEARRLAGGISDMSLWRWIKKGVVPQPLVIERRRYWKRADFIAALNEAAEKSAA